MSSPDADPRDYRLWRGCVRVIAAFAHSLVGRMSEQEARAYHEAGHAVASHYLEQGSLEYVDLFRKEPGGEGFTKLLPIPHAQRQPGKRLWARFTVLMAGRAAEERATNKNLPGVATKDVSEAGRYYIDANLAQGAAVPQADGTLVTEIDPSWFTLDLDNARRFVGRYQHWREIKAIKRRLLLRGRLDGPAAASAVRKAAKRCCRRHQDRRRMGRDFRP